MKTCTKCGESKPVTEFALRRDRQTRRGDCNTCYHAYTRAWAKKNPDRVRKIMRKHDLKRTFGITIAFFEELLHKQYGRCATCATEFQKDNSPRIDHNHKTKEIRGLLCNSCNIALGHAKDNPIVLRRMANYLETGG